METVNVIKKYNCDICGCEIEEKCVNRVRLPSQTEYDKEKNLRKWQYFDFELCNNCFDRVIVVKSHFRGAAFNFGGTWYHSFIQKRNLAFPFFPYEME